MIPYMLGTTALVSVYGLLMYCWGWSRANRRLLVKTITGEGDPENRGAILLDNIIVLFELYKEDYSCIAEALKHIADVRKRKRIPLTVRLLNVLVERGLLDEKPYVPGPRK